MTNSKSREQISKVDVCSETDKRYAVVLCGTVCASACLPAVTHPGGHASGGKPGNIVLKVNPSHPDHVHLVCWVVQGADRKKIT